MRNIYGLINLCDLHRHAKGAFTRRRRTAVTAAALIGLSACSGGDVDFSTWAVEYNRAVETAQNSLQVLNIMRAGDNLPLVLSSVQVVRGNGQTTKSVGVSLSRTFLDYLPPAAGILNNSVSSTVAPSVSLVVSNGFNFDVAILDTAEFQKEFLSPISLPTVAFFLQRGFTVQEIMNMLVASFTITNADLSTRTAFNDPFSPTFPTFQSDLRIALEAGLSIEPAAPLTPVGPVLTAADVKRDIRTITTAAQAGLVLLPVPGGFQYQKATTLMRLCFYNGSPTGPDLPQSVLCDNSPKKRTAKGAGAVSSEAHEHKLQTEKGGSITVNFRSIRDLYTYLGHQIKLQLNDAAAATASGPSTLPTRPAPLLTVVKNRPRPDDLAGVQYRGDHYSIPKDAPGDPAGVLSVLDDLLKLAKSIKSIPPTGTVVAQ